MTSIKMLPNFFKRETPNPLSKTDAFAMYPSKYMRIKFGSFFILILLSRLFKVFNYKFIIIADKRTRGSRKTCCQSKGKLVKSEILSIRNQS